MSGTIVNATNLDSVRIEVLGESRAVTIPAAFLLAADRVMRSAYDAGGLIVFRVEGDGGDGTVFKAGLATLTVSPGEGATPWGAVVALADSLEARR